MSDSIIEALRLQLTNLAHLDGAEILIRSHRFLEIESKDLKIESTRFSESRGIGLRLFRNRRIAHSFSSSLENSALKEMTDKCLEMLDIVEESPNQSLEALSYNGSDLAAQFIDPTFEMVSREEKGQRLINLENVILKSDPKIRRAERSNYEDRLSKEWLWTLGSKKILYSEKSWGSVSASAIAAQNSESRIVYDWDLQSHYYNLNWTAVAKNCSQLAVKLLGAQRIPSGRYSVLFSNRVSSNFIALLGKALSGDNVNRGLSFLAQEKGNKIFSPWVHILDDPHQSKAIGTTFWDAEGVTTRKISFIYEGIPLEFAHNLSSAQEAKTQSTGHASRLSERHAPQVGFHNLYLEPGKKDFVDLERDLHRGLIVYNLLGIHTANPVTGDFSFGANGMWVENSIEQKPVSGIVISGNLKTLFAQVVSVGRDLRWSDHYGAPSFLVEGLNISGE